MSRRRSLFGRLRSYLFPGAGEGGAQPEVRAAVERFRSLPLEQRKRTLLWGWLLGDNGTPPYKFTKDEVDYTDLSRFGANCGNCQRIYFHVPTATYICSAMRGAIEPKGWCSVWEKPTDPDTYRRYQEGFGP